MTSANPIIADIIGAILAREGWPAYTDRAADRGGPTKGGITLATLRAWRNSNVTTLDLQALTEDEARRIYEHQYITGPALDRIADLALRMQVIDAAVMHGPATAIKWLQQAIDVKSDGVLGAVSQTALATKNPQTVGLLFAVARLLYIGHIVHADPSQTANINGWLQRATFFITAIAAKLG